MGRSVPELKIIKERGRDEDEEAVVLIADGLYKGYGFIDRMAQLSTLEDLEAHIHPQRHTVETDSILTSYLLRHP